MPTSALTVISTTGEDSEQGAVAHNDTGDDTNDLDLDMRIKSLEKTITAQYANSAGHNSLPHLSIERLGGSNEDENEDSVQSPESVIGDEGGELNLPSLQTPVSLLEIDSFLQNFERENFEDFTKPPALLMSNQTETSQSPPATSEHSGSVVGDVKRNPSDNTESVDMDLSDEESDILQQSQQDGDKGSPSQSTASYHHGVDESSNDATAMDDSGTQDNQECDNPLMRLPVNSVGNANNNGVGGSSNSSSNSAGGNNQTTPLLQRPPLLPDPTFPPGGGPKWDLPPPSLMSLPTMLGNFNAVIPPPPTPGALVNKLTQPPPGAGQIWADQPPPNGQADVANRFGTPNRPPPPLPFGSGNGGQKVGGSNFRGGGTPRGGRGHTRPPYFRGRGAGGARTNIVPGGLMMGGPGGGPFAGQVVSGTGGSPAMRGGYHRGGGNKFRGGGGGVGGGNNRTGW